VSDPSETEDDLVPEADRQEQALNASGAAELGLTTALRSEMSRDDEVPEADALEQASTVTDEEPERW
jgi:hypothetical protein